VQVKVRAFRLVFVDQALPGGASVAPNQRRRACTLCPEGAAKDRLRKVRMANIILPIFFRIGLLFVFSTSIGNINSFFLR
jgi:hypothetical protein